MKKQKLRWVISAVSRKQDTLDSGFGPRLSDSRARALNCCILCWRSEDPGASVLSQVILCDLRQASLRLGFNSPVKWTVWASCSLVGPHCTIQDLYHSWPLPTACPVVSRWLSRLRQHHTFPSVWSLREQYCPDCKPLCYMNDNCNKIPVWGGMWIMGEAMRGVGGRQGLYGAPLYQLLNFAVSLKPLINSI